MLVWTLLVGAQAAKYLIGNEANSGAWEVQEEVGMFDLRESCHPGKICPPVIMFTGAQVGTIQVSNCEEGVLYSFINKSQNEYGIIVQDAGGESGAKPINQFGVGNCFCYRNSTLLCG